MNIREPRDFRFSKKSAKHKRRSFGSLVGRGAIVLLAVLLMLPALAYFRINQPVQAVKPTTIAAVSAPKEVLLSWPARGQAAIAIPDKGILTNGTQTPVPTASTTKVMVALAVLKKYPLKLGESGPSLTVTQQDIDIYNSYVRAGGSVLPVRLGQKITQYQALQALMLPSANNVADMLAAWAYGSVDAYHKEAAMIAQDLDMTNTHFGGDASGLSPQTVSTARDLTLLGQAAIQDPVLLEIMSQKTANLPVAGGVFNYNFMLGRNGIFGVKTGNTDEAGGAFIFAADHAFADGKTRTFVGAIMGAQSLYGALGSAPPLLESAYAGYGSIQVAKQGQVVAEYSLPWGGKVQAVAADSLETYGWLPSSLNAKIEVNALVVPSEQGKNVGAISIKSADHTVSVPVILTQSVEAPPTKWRLLRR